MKPNNTHKNPTVQMSCSASASETLQFMKTKLTMLKLLILLCSTFATTAVLAQTTFTWTGLGFGTANAAVLDAQTNWTPIAGAPPDPSIGDTAQWDGLTSSNLVLNYTGTRPSFSGNPGANFILTANQTNSVALTYFTPNASSGNWGLNNVTVNGPGGAMYLGDAAGSANNAVINIVPRPNGATHDYINNSASPCIIYPNVRWQAGGGAVFTLLFDGSGDWLVTNDLRNANGTGMLLAKLGTGTWTWNGPSIAGAAGSGTINTPLTFAGGTVIMKWATPFINNDGIVNSGVLFEFDAPGQSQTLNGIISGTAVLQINNGTVTLGGQNTYTGPTLLSGAGVVVLNSAENAGTSGPLGNGGLISLTGGTMQWSLNNQFDYSSRFTNAAGQTYRFDTPVNVTFATGLTSAGATLTKTNAGTLTLAGANTYSGNTTIDGGVLAIQGTMTGTGNIAVNGSGALDVYDTGTQVPPAALTVNSAGASLAFHNVHNTLTPPIAAGSVSAASPITINILSGPLAPGNAYPLFSWSSGTPPPVSLGILNGFIGNLSTNVNEIVLNITATAYKWSGSNNASWDLTTGNDWIQNGASVVYGANGVGPALFDDSASNFNVTVSAAVSATTLTVNNSSNAYSITSSGANNVGGTTAVLKQGNGSLTLLGGANTYSGVTTLSGGTVIVSSLANGASPSDIGEPGSGAGLINNLVLNGGTLQYTGAVVSIDRLFTITPSGGTIDASGSDALSLTNTGSVGYSGTGARTLVLTGNSASSNLFAGVLADNGGPTTLTKSGSGKWILTGNNTHSGGTTINQGLLQVGASPNGSLGSGAVQNEGAIDFVRTGTLTVPGAIHGNGSVTNDGTGTVILAGNNDYTGGTTINAGILQIGNGGATGSLALNSPVVDNSLLVFNSTSPITIRGFNAVISGTGNIEVKGPGLVQCDGLNTYTGWTLIDAGATFQPCIGNEGQLISSVVTNNGTLKLVRQDFPADAGAFFLSNNVVGTGRVWKDVNNQNPGVVTLLGTNTYTGGTLISGGGIMLGNGVALGAGSIVGDVTFTNSLVDDTAGRSLTFNRPDNLTFSGNIIGGTTIGAANQGNRGQVVQIGTNVLTLTGNNTYAGGTVASNGVVQVGNGGTTGTISTNTATAWSEIDFNRSDSMTFVGGINGTGTVAQVGSGTLTLTGNLAMNATVIVTNLDSSTTTNVYVGLLKAANGTLVINSAGSRVANNLSVNGGTLVAGAVGTVTTLAVSNNMTISSGTVVATLNKSLSPSNTTFVVSGALSASGGTLKLLNYGPALVNGDKFTIFSQPVSGGGSMAIVSPGFTVTSTLASDGSVTVASVLPAPTLVAAPSGGNVNLSWPAGWIGIHLQVQTNSTAVGLKGNWVTIPGSDLSNNYIATPNPAAGMSVFYRLAP